MAGIALGAVGLVARPVASILELAGRTAQSIRSWSQPIQQAKRIRPPRYISTDAPLLPYSWEEAIGHAVLREAVASRLQNEVCAASIITNMHNFLKQLIYVVSKTTRITSAVQDLLINNKTVLGHFIVFPCTLQHCCSCWLPIHTFSCRLCFSLQLHTNNSLTSHVYLIICFPFIHFLRSKHVFH